jgi:hypothetical protein
MILPLSITLTIALLAQAKEPADGSKDIDAPARLAYMKDSLKSYSLQSSDPDSAPFKLLEEPIFRLNNAVSGVKDGAIFLWTGDLGRPEAAIQVFKVPSGLWLHEFTSLSTAPIVAKSGRIRAWRPSKPGVEFKPVPDAAKPATTPEQRLRQMRSLAEQFSASDDFETKGWSVLRLLPKPYLRYGKDGGKVEDGALFAFNLASDPEVFLMLEARPAKDGLEWQYAFAPMSCYPLKASWKGKETWSLPLRLPAEDPAGTFFATQYSKGP